MDVMTIRRIAPFVLALAVLIAVFTADGKVVGAVAAIGGVLMAMVYVVLRPPPGAARERNRRRLR